MIRSLAACLVVATAFAAPRAHAADTASAAIATLQATLTKVEHATGSFSAKAGILAPVVDRTFDLETILKNSIGLSYPSIPPADRQSLLLTFRKYTVASYVSNFAGSDDTFSVSPTTRKSGADTIVQTAITPSAGDPTRVDYVMRPEASGARVVDVLLDGTISRVAVQRSDFRSAFADGGAAGLKALLAQKITSLSNGQLQP